MHKISKTIITLAIALSSVNGAQAGFEKADSNQNLLRGSLATKNDLILFNQNALGFVDPAPGSQGNSALNLNRNANGDLIWNGDSIIDANGNLISKSASFTGDLTAPSLIGDLTGTATIASIADALAPAARVDLASQVNGVVPVLNGGTGTTTVTGSSGLSPDTASLVLSNAPTIRAPLNINGELTLGRIDDSTCDLNSKGLIRYNPLGCRLERCDGSNFLAPDARFHRSFVTFEVYPANLVSAAKSFGSSTNNGLEAADFLCQRQADIANLGGDYIALISAVDANGSIVNAIDRIPTTADIKNLDGGFINLCNIWDGFIDGGFTTNFGTPSTFNNPPQGIPYVWTGTKIDGTMGGTCGNWEGRDNSNDVTVGNLNSNTQSWTEDVNAACSSTAAFRNFAHLYCVEKFNI